MPHLLVVGGTGFLGSRLIEVGTRRGFDVSATRHTSTPSRPSASRASWFDCDITSRSQVDELIASQQPDVVVNAAYIQNGPRADVVCADAAGWVADAAQRLDSRVIHVSTDLVFDGNLGRSYTEDDVTNPLSDYGRAKLRGEQLVLTAAPNAAIARTSLIYGDPTAPQESLTRKAVGSDSISLFTDEWRSPVHVEDLAAALVDLAADTFAGVLNVAGAERLSRFEFAGLLATEMGCDPTQLLGRPQDPALGPRAKDVSLDITNALALGLVLPGARERSTSR